MRIIVVLFLMSEFGSSLGLEPESELEFMQLASAWRRQDYPIEDCLFINFGYEKPMPYAQINLDLKQEVNISFLTRDIEAPSGCFNVLIAGKYLKQIDAVMKRIDEIAERNNFVPLLAFIFAKEADIDDTLRLKTKSI